MVTWVMRGRLVAKKNSHRVRGGRAPGRRKNGTPAAWIGNSDEYLSWAGDALLQLRAQRKGRLPYPRGQPLKAEVVVYLDKGQRLDIDNALGGPLDVLQEAGVLLNDSQITELGARLARDPADPRVEVTLTPARG